MSNAERTSEDYIVIFIHEFINSFESGDLSQLLGEPFNTILFENLKELYGCSNSDL